MKTYYTACSQAADLQWDNYRQDFLTLSSIGKTANGEYHRLAYSEEDQLAHELLRQMAQKEHFLTQFDSAGNLWITLTGSNPALRPLLFGSHMDAVPNGGAYDGFLGVFAAFHAMRILKSTPPQRTITLIVFRCEESSRFQCATVGSKLIAGALSAAQLDHYQDAQGISLSQAIASVNGQQAIDLEKQRNNIENALAFIELHIEQGCLLEETSTDLGIVTHIAAPYRQKVVIKGTAAHSGACPMHKRKDALAGAAEIVLAVEQIGKQYAHQNVTATVGSCTVKNGAINIVPGEVALLVDIRGIDKASMQQAVMEVRSQIQKIIAARKLEAEVIVLGEETPVQLHAPLENVLHAIAQNAGFRTANMISGAGHDTMYIASLTRAALCFVPCVQGISHNSAELVTEPVQQNSVVFLLQIMRDICCTDFDENML